MIAILQRISSGSVKVDGEIVASCEKGFLVLLGVAYGDEETDARLLADKIVKMRVFTDENDKMNLSVNDIGGGIMIVPNFTLLASYKKGNRPDFMNSAAPAKAKELFEYFVEYIKKYNENVTTGRFGAHMEVSIVNDGPVTIPMDSNVLKRIK